MEENYTVKKKISFNKRLLLIPLLLLLLGGLYYFVFKPGENSQVASQTSGDGRIAIKDAKAVQDINREFEFPLRDAQGNEVSKVKMTVEKAELRDEILVQGRKATSVQGRTFLVINLKVKNDFSQPLQMDTRNYIRLVLNNNEADQLAPEIYNDPLQVQANSTKITRLGFTVNDSDQSMILKVGEIQGEKQDVALDL